MQGERKLNQDGEVGEPTEHTILLFLCLTHSLLQRQLGNAVPQAHGGGGIRSGGGLLGEAGGGGGDSKRHCSRWR